MAAKKIAKKTTESGPSDAPAPVTPVAKKATKTAKKAVAKKAAPAVKKTTTKIAVKPTLDAIARAAYLNYRRRVELGLPGSSQGDWLDAERQSTELD